MKLTLLITVVLIQLSYADVHRAKRQLYYQDIPTRPRPFRSRAEEKEKAFLESSRTGNLPLEPQYPADFSTVNFPSGLSPYKKPHKPIRLSHDPHLQEKPFEKYHDPPIRPHKPVHRKPPVKVSRPKPHQKAPLRKPHVPQKHAFHEKDTAPNGIPGKDYPIYNEVPHTSFSCDQVPYRPGMYANTEAHCQAYHVCHDDRHGPQGASFLCTNGTLFNQETFSCDWWYNVECDKAKEFYRLNSDPTHNPYYQKPYEEESVGIQKHPHKKRTIASSTDIFNHQSKRPPSIPHSRPLPDFPTNFYTTKHIPNSRPLKRSKVPLKTPSIKPSLLPTFETVQKQPTSAFVWGEKI